jgi:class 3 adenylate cyclase
MRGCSSCGQENPGGFRFCGACGSPLADVPRQPEGEERKVVTVLFCDLVGFTSRSDQAHPSLELAVRIGINTGEALVSLARGADSEGVVGDVVNTAARLQGVAPVNGVVVGEATWRATRTLFAYHQLAPVQVKGKAEPLPIFRVLGPAAGRAWMWPSGPRRR